MRGLGRGRGLTTKRPAALDPLRFVDWWTADGDNLLPNANLVDGTGYTVPATPDNGIIAFNVAPELSVASERCVEMSCSGQRPDIEEVVTTEIGLSYTLAIWVEEFESAWAARILGLDGALLGKEGMFRQGRSGWHSVTFTATATSHTIHIGFGITAIEEGYVRFCRPWFGLAADYAGTDAVTAGRLAWQVGDSLTANTGGDAPIRLARAQLPDWTTKENGVSGAMLVQGVDQTPILTRIQNEANSEFLTAPLKVLWGGSNDINDTNARTAQQCIDDTATCVAAMMGDVIVVGPLRTKSDAGSPWSSNALARRDAVIADGEVTYAGWYVDPYQAILDDAAAKSLTDSDYYSDDIHLNVRGYQVVWDAIQAVAAAQGIFAVRGGTEAATAYAAKTIAAADSAAAQEVADALVTAGIWDKFTDLNLLDGTALADALVPLKGATPTNGNHVGGDYSRTTGLQHDGSTKYLDLGRKPTGPYPAHFGLYASGMTIDGTERWFMGYDVVNSCRFGVFNLTTNHRALLNRTGGVATNSTAATDSCYHVTRRDGVKHMFFRNGAAPFAGTATEATFLVEPAQNIQLGCRINAAGTRSNYSGHLTRAYWVGASDLLPHEVAAFYRILYRWARRLGRV